MSAEREQALDEAAAMLDSWSEHDEKVGDIESAESLWLAAQCVRALKSPGATERCHCDGCHEHVPTCSRSGLCGPCANEDCEHEYGEVTAVEEGDDGAR